MMDAPWNSQLQRNRLGRSGPAHRATAPTDGASTTAGAPAGGLRSTSIVSLLPTISAQSVAPRGEKWSSSIA
jgi:hypothetical protein